MTRRCRREKRHPAARTGSSPRHLPHSFYLALPSLPHNTYTFWRCDDLRYQWCTCLPHPPLHPTLPPPPPHWTLQRRAHFALGGWLGRCGRVRPHHILRFSRTILHTLHMVCRCIRVNGHYAPAYRTPLPYRIPSTSRRLPALSVAPWYTWANTGTHLACCLPSCTPHASSFCHLSVCVYVYNLVFYTCIHICLLDLLCIHLYYLYYDD